SCAAPHGFTQLNDDGQISGYLLLNMQAEVTADRGKLNFQNQSFTIADGGPYRAGMLDERFSRAAGDLNRDGNRAGSSGLFAVLWNESTNTVWIDTNQNHDFTDEKPLTDYRLHHELGLFGKAIPPT